MNEWFMLETEDVKQLKNIIKKEEELIEIMKNNPNEDCLFISHEKRRITARSVSNLVKKYTEEALGYSISPHKLRAAFANIMLKKTNENIYIVQQLLGHSRTETTKIYLDNNINQYNEMAANIISKTLFE